MADESALNPHLSSELPLGARRSLYSADAVVCLSKRRVVNVDILTAGFPFKFALKGAASAAS
jgi:hypothetical protein